MKRSLLLLLLGTGMVLVVSAWPTHTRAQANPGDDSCGGAMVADTPSGPTFSSISCRLDVLLADVQAESQLGKVQVQLARAVQTSINRFADAETRCNASDAKRAIPRIVQTGENLRKFSHRLGATGTRRKVPKSVRGPLADMAKGIRTDVIKLRTSLQCPQA
jgi:hypothetical protein